MPCMERLAKLRPRVRQLARLPLMWMLEGASFRREGPIGR